MFSTPHRLRRFADLARASGMVAIALGAFGPSTASARPCAFDADCDDGKECTADRCRSGRCDHPESESGCDDGNECTQDACVNDRCEHTDEVAGCDDRNPCTDDVCLAGRCEHTSNDGNACTDGNECTVDACRGGRCESASVDGALVCDDGNPCTVDSCSGGRCSHAAADATACDDGDACTADRCVGGRCEHVPATAAGTCDDGNPCTVDACADSACVYTPTDAPGACDDGNACTADRCVDGACAHEAGPATACDDANPCTTDACDPAAGCVHSANDGAACDAGAVCGHGVCAGGECTVVAPDPSTVHDACGDAPLMGVCDGHTLRRCSDGMVETIDCLAQGRACGFDPEGFGGLGAFECVTTSYTPCEGIPDSGLCEGNVLKWCDEATGVTETWDCASEGTTCGWTGSYYCCHAPEECVPLCTGRQCGPDGCGGFCGECAEGNLCGANGTCQPCDGSEPPAPTKKALTAACQSTPRSQLGAAALLALGLMGLALRRRA